MNAFSKQADKKLKESIELDEAAKPGDMYIDPVWGLVQVPYHDLDLGEEEGQ